jgi:cell wall-associated NlpC family hydrolase
MVDQATAAYASAAVAWALARVGEPGYALRCLAFVEDAYERANQIEVFGGASAAESAARYGVDAYRVAEPPPAGALVFYASGGPVDGTWRDWGHVGLALGDGRLVHAWERVRIDDATDVENLEPASGWTRATLLGWTPVERLLEGHRPRSWTDA